MPPEAFIATRRQRDHRPPRLNDLREAWPETDLKKRTLTNLYSARSA